MKALQTESKVTLKEMRSMIDRLFRLAGEAKSLSTSASKSGKNSDQFGLEAQNAKTNLADLLGEVLCSNASRMSDYDKNQRSKSVALAFEVLG